MLSFAEVCRHQRTSGFTASQHNGSFVYAWVQKRGVLDKSSSDGGHDLVLMAEGGFPQVVISGAKSLSTPSFSTDGRFVVAQDGKQAVIGSADSLQVQTWLTLEAGETFEGAPTWMGDVVLFATCGGTSKRSRLHMIAAPAKPTVAADLAARRTLFTAEHGGGLISWDRKPVAPHDVLLVHRLANSMLAELVLVEAAERGLGVLDGGLGGREVAVGRRLEFGDVLCHLGHLRLLDGGLCRLLVNHKRVLTDGDEQLVRLLHFLVHKDRLLGDALLHVDHLLLRVFELDQALL